ncbi:MAG: adenylyltransferase/cytidyltransferase family protein [Nitrospirae bacterium]|nr:adenylyltransferase/cytidyltransferase family protein [Nitrospirota bacterium]
MKIYPLDELARQLEPLRAAGKTIVHCHGCFDLMHPGHIKHFQAARQLGDCLIITLTPDCYVDKGEGRPVFNQTIRAETLSALECVDYVAINKWPTAVETLRLLRPNIYVKGQEFENLVDKTGKLQAEYEVVKEIGAQMSFTHEIVFSSTQLINNHFKPAGKNCRDTYPEHIVTFLKQFSEQYHLIDIVRSIDSIKQQRVLLIGDCIIDEYYLCETMGKSPKAQLLVNRYLSHEVFNGGVMAIANHLAGICDNIHVITTLGAEDSKEEFILNNLKPAVRPKFFYRKASPTIVKRRYINNNQRQKVFEINYIDDSYIDSSLNAQIIEYIKSIVHDYDLIMVADFGHGLITSEIIAALEKFTTNVAVNVQTNGANAGYNLITKYKRVNFICLDEHEARLAVQDKFSSIDDIARALIKEVSFDHLVITLGGNGLLCINGDGEIIKVPAFATKIVDVVGAGDALFTYAASCLAVEMPALAVSFVGNIVGALAVAIVGNKRPVEKNDVLEFINDLLHCGTSE